MPPVILHFGDNKRQYKAVSCSEKGGQERVVDRGLGVGMGGTGIWQPLPEQDPGMAPAAHRG